MPSPSDRPEIPCPDMPLDGAVRYRKIVAEKQKLDTAVAQLAAANAELKAEVAVLRQLLGLAPR